ncbi:unnamed protein product [Rhizoctonia solani]|uniref:Uncharacterized protein n=1 Tax=Rhizoctonia solani TaxID=456999 RepID=A0A8H3D2P6_9AGAM|nr:unnamed protein product [Rhizoctonia solani]CAE6507744.1 unnamed protein product [Rhizoctonia solani]
MNVSKRLTIMDEARSVVLTVTLRNKYGMATSLQPRDARLNPKSDKCLDSGGAQRVRQHIHKRAARSRGEASAYGGQGRER